METELMAGVSGGTEIFETYESEVRSYCRSFPAVFSRARGAELFDEHGRRYLDFFAAAGSLNYGHNPQFVRDRLVEYLLADGVMQGLDMYTVAKRAFIERFQRVILAPRGLDYRMQFCGPTGANAVEAALKLARMVTGRAGVCGFSGGWHGMTMGSLSVTANRGHRAAAGAPLGPSTILPFPDGPRPFPDALAHFESLLNDPNSGLDTPAACIVETVQSEGGIYTAPAEFLTGLSRVCREHGILLIVDDIQAGCGRVGTFFSFEGTGLVPDLICLSKSLSGCGLPMSMLLIRPSLDVWQPGQHTGTFRGNQLAFVAATAALDYWSDGEFAAEVNRKAALLERHLRTALADIHPELVLRGRGLLQGIDVAAAGGPSVAARVSAHCFDHGLIVERCGRNDTVLKLIPPLMIPEAQLIEGLDILLGALRAEVVRS